MVVKDIGWHFTVGRPSTLHLNNKQLTEVGSHGFQQDNWELSGGTQDRTK